MIVPGTTITVSRVLGYIEIRDKGVIQKKIKIKKKSFDEVLSELDAFFKLRGKRLAPGLLEETLVRLGVPRAREIIVEDDEETDEEEVKPSRAKPTRSVGERPPKSATSAPSTEVTTAAETAREELRTVTHEDTSAGRQPDITASAGMVEEKREPSQRRDVQPVEPDGQDSSVPDSGIRFLSGDDFSDILEALSVVENLSDSFVPPESGPKAQEKPQIKIQLEGAEELRATSKTHAADSEMLAAAAQATEHAMVASPDAEEEAAVGVVVEGKAAESTDHIIKPIVTAKAIIVGEEGVGKKSLLEKAKMAHPIVDGEMRTYVYEKTFELPTHRVQLQSWCFDDAVKSRVSRRDFYGSAGVAIIVYSTDDRWSFDSIDFWVKEVVNSVGSPPPIVLVGNKVDLRKQVGELRNPPVTTEEGYELAETLANELGTGETLHPVGFIETSCLTGQGVDSVFITAAKLWLKTLSKNAQAEATS
ncbi:MAG: Rab family GTPase [Candidatus Thorarchaeota archaeon]